MYVPCQSHLDDVKSRLRVTSLKTSGGSFSPFDLDQQPCNKYKSWNERCTICNNKDWQFPDPKILLKRETSSANVPTEIHVISKEIEISRSASGRLKVIYKMVLVSRFPLLSSYV